MKKVQLIILLIFVSITTYTWFLDGYHQPIDPDTFGEMTDEGLNLRFPEMLTAPTNYHSKWFAKALPYTSFTTIAPVYSAITGNKAQGLFVAQGFMTALTYVLFIFLSAYYISLCAAPFSPTFLLCYLFVSAFILMGGSVVYHYNPFIFRFYHMSVLGNYMWTFNALMLVFLPYWRYYLYSKWDDWHSNVYLKTSWLLSIIFCAFSSSCTTVIALGLSFAILLLKAIYNFYKNKSGNKIWKRFTDAFKTHNEIYYGLYVLIVLCSIALASEKTGHSGEESKTFFSNPNYIKQFKDYCYIFKEFVTNKSYLKGYLWILVIAGIEGYLIRTQDEAKNRMAKKLVLASVFLLTTAIIYSFIIGTEQLPYRFRGTNLGGDTLLYFSWSLMFIILSFTVYFIVNTKIKIITPLLIFIAVSHVVASLSNYPYYKLQRKEMNGFNIIMAIDKLNTEGPVLLPKSYSDALNMWNLGESRLTDFAYKTKLTKTGRKFKMVEDKDFLEAYTPYYPQLKDMMSRY